MTTLVEFRVVDRIANVSTGTMFNNIGAAIEEFVGDIDLYLDHNSLPHYQEYEPTILTLEYGQETLLDLTFVEFDTQTDFAFIQQTKIDQLLARFAPPAIASAVATTPSHTM